MSDMDFLGVVRLGLVDNWLDVLIFDLGTAQGDVNLASFLCTYVAGADLAAGGAGPFRVAFIERQVVIP